MHFSGEFTAGNIIMLVVMIFGFGVSWTHMGADIAAIKHWIKEHLHAHELKDRELDDLRIRFARHEGNRDAKV